MNVHFLSCSHQVGSGYSKKQLKDFNLQLAPHWRVYDKKKPPPHLELASGIKEKPDAWLPPDKSCILQVRIQWTSAVTKSRVQSLNFVITKVSLQTRFYIICIISFNVISHVVLNTHEANSRHVTGFLSLLTVGSVFPHISLHLHSHLCR